MTKHTSSGKTRVRLGHSQAKISRRKKHTLTPKAGRLALGKASAKNLISGTIDVNRGKKKSPLKKKRK